MISQPKTAYLLGSNNSDSISPAIQNAAFRALGIDANYELKELARHELSDCVSQLKSPGVLGFNVTAPFKEEIIHELTALDPLSKKIMAVNTVKLTEKQDLMGFNTDYHGIIATFEKLGLRHSQISKSKHEGERKALLLGAGGAARACVLALRDCGFAHITILNRTLERAQLISEQFSKYVPFEIKTGELTKDNLEKSLEQFEIVINALSAENSFPFSVMDLSNADSSTKFFDLDYKRESSFLKAARENGFETIDGLLMLVEQARKSTEIWTGSEAPFDVMMNAAKEALQKKKT